MNFFEHQEQARKNTNLLLLLFFLAIISIIFSLYTVAKLFIFYTNTTAQNQTAKYLISPDSGFLDIRLLSLVTVITLVILGAGAIVRMFTLGTGGEGVAKMMGGVLISPSTTEVSERRLLNVVEEMAIASGVPVPQVYLLKHESTINAFAAGTNPSNSVIGVTKGAIENLSRDELQGVIAHEFSHIFNGDMKLNLKLISVISGIVVISTIGRIFLNMRSHRVSSDRKGNPFPAIGVILIIVGSIGVFFARLIKAAVSRQREFLADASAVQYTRNPNGIANALDKIGRMSYRKLVSPYAEETSHMMFETPFRNFGGLLSTHPPVQERIKKIAPNFVPQAENANLNKPKALKVEAKVSTRNKLENTEARYDVLPGKLRNRFGTLSLDSLAIASEIIESTPDNLISKAHEELGSRALVLAMTFKPSQKEEALKIIRSEIGPKLTDEVDSIYSHVQSLDKSHRLPLLEICMPALRLMDTEKFKKYYSALERLVQLEDGDVVFEFCLLRIVEKAFTRPHLRNSARYSIKNFPDEVLSLLKFASHVGADSPEHALNSFAVGVEYVNRSTKTPLKKLNIEAEFANMPDIQTLSPVLKNLNRLEPSEKSALLMGCAMSISSDGRITNDEMDLLRAVSVALDTPLPANAFS